ncbi:hypothetical protein F2Q70_00039587 [Brassica cretica]|uniref:HD-Zip IV C-terminal domain-containing protein n=1 Tax=Brassica cretica TaxID=69181 RepID=A0A8S9K794_BRACR|nr:hypothetical protein F2Q70_00039587 [Brassica cretica]
MIELFWFCHSHAQKHDKLDNLYHHHTYHLESASSALFIEDRTYSGYILLRRKKVYLTLGYTLFFSSCGSSHAHVMRAHMHMFFNPLATSVCFDLDYISLILTESWGYPRLRLGVLILIAFLKGVSAGSIMELVFDWDIKFYITLLLGGSLLFPCLYATTGAAKWRDVNYLMAILLFVISIPIWLEYSLWIPREESLLSDTVCRSKEEELMKLSQSMGPSSSSNNVEWMLQEICTDNSGTLVVYSTADANAVHLAMNGQDSSTISLLPLGFSVVPVNQPHVFEGISVNLASCLLTVAVQVLVSDFTTATLNVSTTAINNRICSTVYRLPYLLRSRKSSSAVDSVELQTRNEQLRERCRGCFGR